MKYTKENIKVGFQIKVEDNSKLYTITEIDDEIIKVVTKVKNGKEYYYQETLSRLFYELREENWKIVNNNYEIY